MPPRPSDGDDPVAGVPARGPLRRILVAIDASAHSLAALEAAAELAESHGAELVGLFVEDEELVRLAAISPSREIDLFSAERRPLEREEVERMFRRQEARAREILHRVAERRSVRSVHFDTARGRVTRVLLEAARGVDLITVGTRGWVPGRRPGSTVRGLLESPQAPPIMVIRHGARLGETVFALHDGSQEGLQATRVAASIAAAREVPATVLLLVSADGGVPDELAEQSQRILESAGARGTVRGLPARSVREFLEYLRTRHCGLLVGPRPERSSAAGEMMREIISMADCPVLLVSRQRGGES